MSVEKCVTIRSLFRRLERARQKQRFIYLPRTNHPKNNDHLLLSKAISGFSVRDSSLNLSFLSMSLFFVLSFPLHKMARLLDEDERPKINLHLGIELHFGL